MGWWVANGDKIDGMSGSNVGVKLVIIVLLAKQNFGEIYVRLLGS